MFLQTTPVAFRETKKLLLQSFDLPFPRFLDAYLKGQRAGLVSLDRKVASKAYLTKKTSEFAPASGQVPFDEAQGGLGLRPGQA